MRSKSQHIKHCHYIEGQEISQSERKHYSKAYGVNRRSILCDLSQFMGILRKNLHHLNILIPMEAKLTEFVINIICL